MRGFYYETRVGVKDYFVPDLEFRIVFCYYEL